MPIDVHAHYVPPQLIDAVAARGKDIGVQLVKSGDAPPALQFDYGFKVNEADVPFLPPPLAVIAVETGGVACDSVTLWPVNTPLVKAAVVAPTSTVTPLAAVNVTLFPPAVNVSTVLPY